MQIRFDKFMKNIVMLTIQGAAEAAVLREGKH